MPIGTIFVLALSAQTDTTPFDRFGGRMAQVLDAPGTGYVGQGLEEAVHVYAGAMRRRYADAAAGDGTWKLLAKSTIASKRGKTAWPERILYLTGALYSSLTPGAAGNVMDTARDRITYGTRVRYAKYHQKGGGRLPRRRILARPNADVLARCTAPIVAGLKRTIDAATGSLAA